jgi:hypothetical protein
VKNGSERCGGPADRGGFIFQLSNEIEITFQMDLKNGFEERI